MRVVTAKIYLKRGREAAVRRFHQWVFSGAIDRVDGAPEDGDWVEVKDAQKQTLGFGHYQKGTITVRVISFLADIPDEMLYAERIMRAFQQRVIARVLNEHTNCYRLIHGEGDGLSGLIVDVYNGVAVMQAHTVGMHLDRTSIANAIQMTLANSIHTIYYKSQNTLPVKTENEYLMGMGAVPHIIMEHGNKFYVDWEEGQKTGFFLDQRENRKLLSEYAKGAAILNTFCYTGGFSVAALNAGAKLVHSVDASEKAVRLTEKNIALNDFDPEQHACFTADTFEFFKEKKENYNLIVLDPPAFAKHRDARHQAMKGYQRLNAEAMRIISANGIIFTFSCSQVVDKQLFYDTIVSAGLQAGREIKVLQQLSQPADHPVSLYHPEGEYLKGLVLYVS